MTRLINFGLGEIVDRLTILALKIRHTEDSLAFQSERDQLVALIKPHTAETVTEWADLASVNNQLWQAEDKMRGYRERKLHLTTHDHFDVSDVAMQIQEFNDHRAELIRSINLSQGDGHVEKAEDFVP